MTSQNRKKLFFENILIYGLGSAMNMVIPFIMLPIISRLLPSTDYYGINDTVTIFVSFGSAIAMMGMYDAMYRFYFDKEDVGYHKKVCSTALFTVITIGFIVMTLSLILRKPLSELLFSDSNYTTLIVIGALNIWVSCINSIVAAPTRMKNQRLRYISIQTLIPIITYCFSIIMILKGEYVHALPLASLISNIIVCIVFFVFNRNDFNIKCAKIDLLRPMIKFGAPLMPIFVFFWILSSVGRIIITNTWGLEQTGIYAAAGKLASVSQLIYSAFAGGWQYFAFSTMKDEDYVELISKVFDYLSGLTFLVTAVLIIVIKPVFLIMLPSGYQDGILVAPALFIAPLTLMLRQTIGMHFQVQKKNIISSFTIGVGAAVAITLYLTLIPLLGIRGAAVGSLGGYIATLIITISMLVKMKLLILSRRIYVGFLLTITLLTLHMINFNGFYVILFAFAECILIAIYYRKDILLLIKTGKAAFISRRN
jgi:O-antigen/teichoic acid export membrane protein